MLPVMMVLGMVACGSYKRCQKAVAIRKEGDAAIGLNVGGEKIIDATGGHKGVVIIAKGLLLVDY